MRRWLPSQRRRLLLAGLFIAAVVIQASIVTRAHLPAPDVVGFVAQAQQIERDGLWQACREQAAPPLFPWVVSLMHRWGVAGGWLDEHDWGRAAQWSAALALILTLLPLTVLARHLVGPSAAIVAGLWWLVMTEPARLGGDGLSDSWHLLLFATALAVLVTAGRQLQRVLPRGEGEADAWWDDARGWIAGGALIGVALWARGESLTLLAAALGGLAWSWRWSQARGRVTAAFVGLLVGFTAVWGPYLVWLDLPLEEAPWKRLTGRVGPSEDYPFNAPAGLTLTAISLPDSLGDGAPLEFGRKDPSVSSRFQGAWAASRELIREQSQALQHGMIVLTLLGLAGRLRRGRWRHASRGVERGLLAWMALYWLAVWGVAWTQGYLSGRHVLPVVIVCLPWAGRGLLLGAMVLSRAVRGISWHRWATVGAAATAAACLAITLRPLNATRVAHQAAGEWLRAQADTGAVLDTHGMTALATGRITYRYERAREALADDQLRYVVVEATETAHRSRRAETMRRLLSRWAEPAARFEPPGGRGPEVVVYRWQPERSLEHVMR